MAIYYVDPSAAASRNGSLASPFRSWTSVTWASGNTYLQKRGTTYSGVFRIAASGTAGQRITVGAYARADGADDPSRPKPIIQLPAAPVAPPAGASVAVHTQERDYITYRNLDIRNPALPQASDVAILWIGNDCLLENLAEVGRGGERLHRGFGAGQLAVDGLHQRAPHVQGGALDAGAVALVGLGEQQADRGRRRQDEGRQQQDQPLADGRRPPQHVDQALDPGLRVGGRGPRGARWAPRHPD